MLTVSRPVTSPGLVYIRQPDNATSASSRLAALFFLTFVFQMSPFSYMSFYFSDRRFFIKDSANGLYAPSAYQMATLTAGAPPHPPPFLCLSDGHPQRSCPPPHPPTTTSYCLLTAPVAWLSTPLSPQDLVDWVIDYCGRLFQPFGLAVLCFCSRRSSRDSGYSARVLRRWSGVHIVPCR